MRTARSPTTRCSASSCQRLTGSRPKTRNRSVERTKSYGSEMGSDAGGLFGFARPVPRVHVGAVVEPVRERGQAQRVERVAHDGQLVRLRHAYGLLGEPRL